MKYLDDFSRKIGFTQTESKIILFITAALITGLTINLIKEKRNNKDLLQFDYSKQDSMFWESAVMDGSKDSSGKIPGKTIDYQTELLDFNGAKKAGENSQNSDFLIKFVDINTASIEELATLPGIGAKTAGFIIDYRSKKGKFSNVKDLLKVKGIGNRKFEKLKKYVIIK